MNGLRIVRRCADMWDKNEGALMGRSKTRCIVRPRQTMWFIFIEVEGFGFAETGRFCKRDHTTIMHGVGIIRDILQNPRDGYHREVKEWLRLYREGRDDTPRTNQMTADAVKVSWKVACTIQQPCEFSSRERSIFGAFERASEIVGVDVGDAVRLGVWRWDAQRARHLAVAALSGKGFSDDEITQAMGWVSLPSNDVPLSMYDEIVVRSIQGAT